MARAPCPPKLPPAGLEFSNRGWVGVLGQDYEGYFPVGDTNALRSQLIRAEGDPAFVQRLTAHVQGLAPQFTIAAETGRWKELLDEVAGLRSAA